MIVSLTFNKILINTNRVLNIYERKGANVVEKLRIEACKHVARMQITASL